MEHNPLKEYNYSDTIFKTLSNCGFIKGFLADQTVLDENSNIKAIPIVINGSLRVMRTEEDGREILLYYIKPGESCIMSFLGGMHYQTSKVKAISEENSEILFIPVDKVNILIKENPEWLDYIFRLYHKRFEELLEIINEVTFKKMDERLLNLIRKKAELTNNKTINITHEQLSNELGTARVVVSRLLKQMEENNMVKLGRNKIILV